MYIYVNVKQLGKKRDKIQKQRFFLEHTPKTVEELIEEAVTTCVTEFNEKPVDGQEVQPLSQEAIEEMSEIGKIAFGIQYGEKKADLQKAKETAKQAFLDGLFRIFLEDRELSELGEQIELPEEATVTFIRLTMLTGRMF